MINFDYYPTEGLLHRFEKQIATRVVMWIRTFDGCKGRLQYIPPPNFQVTQYLT